MSMCGHCLYINAWASIWFEQRRGEEHNNDSYHQLNTQMKYDLMTVFLISAGEEYRSDVKRWPLQSCQYTGPAASTYLTM